VRRTLIVLGSLLASVAVAAPAAQASSPIPCGDRVSSQAFTQWGDPNDYFLAPGGAFETGLGGWYGYGATTAPENEPWSVFGTGASSLMTTTAKAVRSPAFCIAAGEESVRLFVKRPGVAGAELDIRVTASQPGVYGFGSTQYTVAGDEPGWTVTDPIPVPAMFGTAGTETLTIAADPDGAAAPWLIDDVAIDPYRPCC
jgi:hypothetical protein